MGISVEDMPDRHVRCRARAKFVADIGFNFPVGVFAYERLGTLGKWHVVFRMELGHNEKHHDFIGAVVDASKEAPTYLLRCQTVDAIDTIF